MALIGFILAAALQVNPPPPASAAPPPTAPEPTTTAAPLPAADSPPLPPPPTTAQAPPTVAETPEAAPPREPTPEDPWEGANRGVYAVNLKLDKYLFRPVAVTYRRLLPRPVRGGIHNALRNWDEPGVLLNDLLQGRLTDAGHATFRFAVNTTLGLFGVFDIAARRGVTHHENGFAITLGRYGVAPGPYLFLPFAGPSTVRDLMGAGVDMVSNPLTNIRGIRSKTLEKAQTVASIVDNRAHHDEDLQEIAVSATDPYASLRSIYLQTVKSQINGDEISLSDSPDIPGAPELPEGKKALQMEERNNPLPSQPSGAPPKAPPPPKT